MIQEAQTTNYYTIADIWEPSAAYAFSPKDMKPTPTGLNMCGGSACIMCLAIPARVLEVKGDSARVDFGKGTVKTVNVALLDRVIAGQYVIVHAGFAIQVMDEREAKKTLDLWQEMLEAPQT